MFEMKKSLCALVLFLVLLASQADVSHATRRHRRQERDERRGGRMFSDLSPQEPRVELETDGGRLEVWGGRGSGVFEDANVAACRTTLKRRGLWLPSYVDSPTLHVVTEGCGRVGIISPFGDRYSQENTFKVEKGDVVATPEGHVVWWYNDGERDLEIVGAADATESPRPASVRAFHLAGGSQEREEEREREREREPRRREEEEEEREREREREPRRREDESREQEGYRAVIHGFSTEVLARAWEMDKSTVQQILKGQSEVGIVRVDEDISFPDSSQERHRRSNVFFQNYIYRFSKVHPDIRVRKGGELRELNSYKLPVLKFLGLGMECMKLEQGAMVSPNYFQNGHQILYVTEGRGRIEAVHNNGERALDEELSKGSLVIIPAFFPSTKIAADDEEFHYISFVTSDRPVMSYLSGRKSVYQGIPLRVLAKILNVDEERARQIQRAHERESVIFSPEKESRRKRGEGGRRREEDEGEERQKRREEEEEEERRRRREEEQGEEKREGRKGRDESFADMAWSLAAL